MIIGNRSYVVIKEIGVNDGVSVYLLKREDANLFYTATKQPRETVNGEEIKFLFEQSKNEIFQDFMDYYTTPEYLYVIMKYEESLTLSRRLEEQACTLVERLEIAKKILEKLVILNMPTYFLGNIMDLEKIMYSDSMEVSFDYRLYDIANFNDTKSEDVGKKLAKIFEELFHKELQMKAMKEIQSLIKKLEQGKINQLDDVISTFFPIYTKYMENPNVEAESKTYKNWEKIKSLTKHLALVMKILLMGLAIAYLVVTIIDFNSESDVQENFTWIGTEEIRNTDIEEVEE